MPNTISTLPDTALVARLYIAQWQGFKYDRQLSEQLVSQHGAERGTARVNKLIVEKEWIDPITQALGRVYAHHVKHTLPWLDNGSRILASRMHVDYMSEHKRLVRDATDTIQAGLRTYPEQIRSAPKRLNGMCKISDFPPPSRLAEKFIIELNFLPVPVDDIRCAGVSSEELGAMNASKERELERAIESANRDAWMRMYSAVRHMVDRLKLYEDREQRKGKGEKVGKEGTFKDSIVDNIRELVELLPKMNFSGDESLDKMVAYLDRKLCGADADALRESAATRTDTIRNADKILKAMMPYVTDETEATA